MCIRDRLIASCGESKRSDFYDYPVVSKKEFDSLLEKLKESEDTLPGGHALDSFFLSSQEMDKHAGKQTMNGMFLIVLARELVFCNNIIFSYINTIYINLFYFYFSTSVV